MDDVVSHFVTMIAEFFFPLPSLFYYSSSPPFLVFAWEAGGRLRTCSQRDCEPEGKKRGGDREDMNALALAQCESFPPFRFHHSTHLSTPPWLPPFLPPSLQRKEKKRREEKTTQQVQLVLSRKKKMGHRMADPTMASTLICISM